MEPPQNGSITNYIGEPRGSLGVAFFDPLGGLGIAHTVADLWGPFWTFCAIILPALLVEVGLELQSFGCITRSRQPKVGIQVRCRV